MKILNLTQHPATPEQIAAGVVDLTGEALTSLKAFLTFDSLPSEEVLAQRAEWVCELVSRTVIGSGDDLHEDGTAIHCMIGGAPFFMRPLQEALELMHCVHLFAFSARESVETTGADGSVTKTAVFRHKGFV
jgi:hypothetical protein